MKRITVLLLSLIVSTAAVSGCTLKSPADAADTAESLNGVLLREEYASPESTEYFEQLDTDSLTGDILQEKEMSYGDRAKVSESILIDLYSDASAETGVFCAENLKVCKSAASGANDYEFTLTNFNKYTYGTAEVYNENDECIKILPVLPSISQSGDKTSAVKTDVKVTVPEGGYVFITCNPENSVYAGLYNAAGMLAELVMAEPDMAAAARANPSDALRFKNALIEKTVEISLQGQGENAAELALNMCDFMKNAKNVKNGVTSELKYTFACSKVSISDILAESLRIISENTDNTYNDFISKAMNAVGRPIDLWKTAEDSDIFDFEGACKELISQRRNESLLIEISGWRKAYADLLREKELDSGKYFFLRYLDEDDIPELIVVIYSGGHYGSFASIYSYRNRQAVPIADEYGRTEIQIPYYSLKYAERRGVIITMDLQQGYKSLCYLKICGNNLKNMHIFSDDEWAVADSEPTYKYNGSAVPKWYYEAQIYALGEEYADTECIEDYENNNLITEANILRELGRQ